MRNLTPNEKYATILNRYFDTNSLISTFPAISEIDNYIKEILGLKKYVELYPKATKMQGVCTELMGCKEYPLGQKEKAYLKDVNNLLTEVIESHNI